MFDKMNDKIAFTMTELQLLRKADGIFDRYSEPYVVSLAVDSDGVASRSIKWNVETWPKIAKGGKCALIGDGYMIYAPKNPGEFLAVSLLVMESDQDIRNFGKHLETVIKSEGVKLSLDVILASNPSSAGVLAALKELTSLVASSLQKNRDDMLFRVEGTFLRDTPNPYHINRQYQVGNDFISLTMGAIPLDVPNGQGALPHTIQF